MTTYNEAIRTGDLEALKQLKDNGCLLDKDIFSEAIHAGNLEIMIWLKEQDCPIPIAPLIYTNEESKNYAEALLWVNRNLYWE